MSSSNLNQIVKETKKWLAHSQKFRTSSIIIESKIRGNLAVFEKKATTQQINSLQTDLGKNNLSKLDKHIILKSYFYPFL